VANKYIGDTRPLFEGVKTIKEAINKNIDTFLQGRVETRWGVKVRLTVTTKKGTLLYPTVFDENDITLRKKSTKQIASENYEILNEGLIIDTDLKIEHATLFSNTILGFYIILSIVIIYSYYRIAVFRTRQEELEKNNRIEKLLSVEEQYAKQIESYVKDRERLTHEIKEIKNKLENEKTKASRVEDEMINEIIILENKIEENITLQKVKENEIEVLKQDIKNFEDMRKKQVLKKRSDSDSIQKRFRALYKNISFHQRALEGFVYLTEDMQIKVEQVIHSLNNNPDVVPIKRKVFGKKNRISVQEVIFSYKGRLYFHKTHDNKIEILVIGTKNTQLSDMEFINSL